MLPVSPRELARLRSDAASAACDTPGTIQRKTATRDAYGTTTVIWVTVAQSMVGIASPSGSQLQQFAGELGSLTAWRVQFPYGTDCQEGDHLLIGGDTLIIQVNLSPQSYDVLATFLASEVKSI